METYKTMLDYLWEEFDEKYKDTWAVETREMLSQEVRQEVLEEVAKNAVRLISVKFPAISDEEIAELYGFPLPLINRISSEIKAESAQKERVKVLISRKTLKSGLKKATPANKRPPKRNRK